jgi:hypothetical protein
MRIKVQVAMLCLFFFTARCIGLPTEHTVNGTIITTVNPDGFVDVTDYRKLQKKVHEDNPKLPKLLNIYVSQAEALQIASQNPDMNIYRQVRVCLSNTYTNRVMTQADFDKMKDILKNKYTANRFSTIANNVNIKKSKTLSEELKNKYDFKTLATLQLGIDYEDNNKIIWTVAHSDKISTSQNDEQKNILTTGVMILLKGKLLNIYCESVFNSEEDFLWCQKVSLEYARKLEFANTNGRNVKTANPSQFAQFERENISFTYPTSYTLKETLDKGDQIILLESLDSNSVLFEIVPKVLELEKESLDTFERIKEMYTKNGSTSITDITEKTTVEIAELKWRVSQFSLMFNQMPWQCDLYVTQNNWKTLTVLCQYATKDKKLALDRFSQIVKTLSIKKNVVEADLNRCRLLARDMYVSIFMANSERAKYGLKAIWPTSCSTVLSGAGSGDISNQSFVSSSSFFNCILDMPNYKTSKWNPYVSNLAMTAISAAVSSTRTETNGFSKANNMWIVAANIEEGDSDNLPVLISRNVVVAELENIINKGMLQDDLKNVIQLGSTYKTPFGNQGAIVVRKGGGISVILPGKSAVLDFVGYPVELDRSKPRNPIKYLLP